MTKNYFQKGLKSYHVIVCWIKVLFVLFNNTQHHTPVNNEETFLLILIYFIKHIKMYAIANTTGGGKNPLRKRRSTNVFDSK